MQVILVGDAGSAIPVIRLGFFLIALKQGTQGEHFQVSLLHQLQPGGGGLDCSGPNSSTWGTSGPMGKGSCR